MFWDDLTKWQKIGWGVIIWAVLMTVFFGSLFILGFPTGGLALGVVAALHLGAYPAYKFTKKGDGFSGFKTTAKSELSSVEAKELAWYFSRKFEGHRVDRVIRSGDVPEKGDFEDKDEARRLYKFEFRPLNVRGKICLYMALDQELSVDIDDNKSLKKAAKKIRSTHIVRSWEENNYEEEKRIAREKLGMAATPEVFLDTGDGEAERVKVLPNQVPQQGGQSAEE